MDVQIALGVTICLLSAVFLPWLQSLSAGTAVMLCSQDSVKVSWKTGLTRLIITLIGGGVAVLAVLIDSQINNQYAYMILVFLGLLLTILLCKAAKVPYISARIGCVTFILVATVSQGTARMTYALMRLVGTFYGVLIALTLTFIFSKAAVIKNLKIIS